MQLDTPLEKITRIDATQKQALKRLGLLTVRDLLYYFPTRYSHISNVKQIRDLAAGETATVYGTITSIETKKSFKTKIPMSEATIEDLSGSIKILWFHQAYMAKMIHEGQMVSLTGKVSSGTRGLYFSNPEVETGAVMPIDSHDSLFGDGSEAEAVFGYPVYAESRGVTSRWMYHTIKKIFQSGLVSSFEEYIPEPILKKYKLPSIATALVWIHTPKNENDAEAARKRFAFEEVFFIQLKRQQERGSYEENRSYDVHVYDEDLQDFISRFPFTPTKAQQDAISAIQTDMAKKHPMARLLEGDVGSGKTAVAASAAYAVIRNRPKGQDFGALQVAYMAPTEILAVQHFENFIKYFTHTGIQIGLITGSGCRKFPSKVASSANSWTNISRNQLLKWVANGEVPIVIGTHALIQKNVKFKDLALVIIDEQHRFGALQRAKLAKKENFAPHYLSMTATPIPRTLALTIYGDLDLTLLDQMPIGRKPVITEIVLPDKREQAYELIRKEMAEGRQLYVICPRIDEPDPAKETALNLKSVTAEAERLERDVFPGKTVAILHSKMKKEDKEYVMQEFAEGRADILVATSVVEVGVNVPNATLIVIEGAERFGLSQLHQLRGRVIRSNHQAYCFAFAESKSEKTRERLKAFKNAKNGFELAELDLTLRGAGELTGTKQWGMTDLGMEAIKNIKMVEAARTEAISIIEKDVKLVRPEHAKLSAALSGRRLDDLHFE
jgi:ATP-dependent DNA helicase RecG